jgi:hypothetical protein
MTKLLKQLLHSNNPYICQTITTAQRLKPDNADAEQQFMVR